MIVELSPVYRIVSLLVCISFVLSGCRTDRLVCLWLLDCQPIFKFVCRVVSVSVGLSVELSIYLSVVPSVCRTVGLFIFWSVCLRFGLPLSKCGPIRVWLSLCQFASVEFSVCPSYYLPLHMLFLPSTHHLLPFNAFSI